MPQNSKIPKDESEDVWRQIQDKACQSKAFIHKNVGQSDLEVTEKQAFRDTVDFLNPLHNSFERTYSYEGKMMDYFGYTAHRMTAWKRQHIFDHNLAVRAVPVIGLSVLSIWCRSV